MTIFNVKKSSEQSLQYLHEKCNYVSDCRATSPDLIYGCNVNLLAPYQDMELAKEIFHQEQGKTCYHHILSIAEDDIINESDYFHLSVKVCDLLSTFHGNYQVLMAVHTNTENLHTHYICNNIDFLTGQRLDFDLSKMYECKEKINAILSNYSVSLITKNTYAPITDEPRKVTDPI